MNRDLFKNHRKNHKKHWLSCHSNNLRRLVVENLRIYSFRPRRPAYLSNRLAYRAAYRSSLRLGTC